MDLKKNVLYIASVSKVLLRDPSAGWAKIFETRISSKDAEKSYFGPMIGAVMICSFLGGLYRWIMDGYGDFVDRSIGLPLFETVILDPIIIFISYYFALFVCKVVLEQQFIRKNEAVSRDSITVLLIFSFVPHLIINALVSITPWFYLLYIAGLYSYYLMYVGLDSITNASKENRLTFMLITSLIHFGALALSIYISRSIFLFFL